jgi:hypothetical protein
MSGLEKIQRASSLTSLAEITKLSTCRESDCEDFTQSRLRDAYTSETRVKRSNYKSSAVRCFYQSTATCRGSLMRSHGRRGSSRQALLYKCSRDCAAIAKVYECLEWPCSHQGSFCVTRKIDRSRATLYLFTNEISHPFGGLFNQVYTVVSNSTRRIMRMFVLAAWIVITAHIETMVRRSISVATYPY